MQLELFPDYPRLSPPQLVLPPVKDWTWLEEAWATLDYPEEEETDEAMAQNVQQGNLINYIKSVLDVCLESVENGFNASDLFMHRTIKALQADGKTRTAVEKLAPDVIFVQNAFPRAKRGSFDAQKDEKSMRDAWRAQTGEEMPAELVNMKILVVEIMSPSNYATAGDIWKRYQFYQNAQVQEYLVVHTHEDALYLEFFVNREGILLKMLDFPEHTSTLANVVFKITDNDLVITTPDGDVFLHYEDERKMKQAAQQKLVEKEHLLTQERAEKERERAEKERERKLRLKLETEMERERQEERRAMEDMKRKLAEAQQFAAKWTE